MNSQATPAPVFAVLSEPHYQIVMTLLRLAENRVLPGIDSQQARAARCYLSSARLQSIRQQLEHSAGGAPNVLGDGA